MPKSHLAVDSRLQFGVEAFCSLRPKEFRMEDATAEHQVIEVERHLRQLDDEWIKALVRRDAETLDRIIADDFVFAYPLEGDDKAQFISDVTSGQLKVEHISRGQVSVRVFGRTAVLTARDSATWLYHGRE